jgi:hypothetical protein
MDGAFFCLAGVRITDVMCPGGQITERLSSPLRKNIIVHI